MFEKVKKKHSIKLGFLPTRRNVFSKEEAGRIKNLIELKVGTYGYEYVNLDWLNEEGLIFSGLDAERVAKKFICEEVDAIFAPHCNFGTEDAIAKVAKKVGKPLLIWGPQDDAPSPDGYRLRDTQCGMFATTKILNREGVPFTYITNSHIDDMIFDRGFGNFLSSASVVKSFRSLRIGQISTRPGAFWSVICNEGELLERFGIETVPTTLVDIAKDAESIIKGNGVELKETIQGIKGKVGFIQVNNEELEKLAALKLAIRHWADCEGLSSVAIQCWSALQKEMGIAPCFVNGELTGEGLPVVCETDIHGAVTSVMVQAAALGEKPVFFADLTIRHPENKNAELLWHCGNFPHSLLKEGEYNGLTEHFGMPYPGAGDFEIKGGDITVSRFDGLRGEYYLLMGHGRGVEGPRNKGTYVWVEFNDWPLWEEKFIYGPYIHHCTGIHGKYAPALFEACRYIPGLKPDPVDPTEAGIRKFLRG